MGSRPMPPGAFTPLMAALRDRVRFLPNAGYAGPMALVMTPGLKGLIVAYTLAQVSVHTLRQYSMAFCPYKPLGPCPTNKYRLV